MNLLREFASFLAAGWGGLSKDGEGPQLLAAPGPGPETDEADSNGAAGVVEDKDWAVLAASFHF